MVWSNNDNWMVTGDHGGFVKYWQSNMNNVKMFQAHKEPIRGIRYFSIYSLHLSCCGWVGDHINKRSFNWRLVPWTILRANKEHSAPCSLNDYDHNKRASPVRVSISICCHSIKATTMITMIQIRNKEPVAVILAIRKPKCSLCTFQIIVLCSIGRILNKIQFGIPAKQLVSFKGTRKHPGPVHRQFNKIKVHWKDTRDDTRAE